MAEDGPAPLSEYKRRVLGVMVEKAKTTPDGYPMTLNGLRSGCNQKSNRDPVMDLADDEIEDTLEGLQNDGLVEAIYGTRAEKYKHKLYDKWGVNKLELAVLAELFLRGAQSIGDLRGRVSRMEPLESLEELREVLGPLVERKMAVWLTDAERRGAVITHGFQTAEGVAAERAKAGSAAPAAAKPAVPPGKVEELARRVDIVEEQLLSALRRIEELEKRG